MKEKKKIQEAELKNVSGGDNVNDPSKMYCSKCSNSFSITDAEHRDVGSGCDKHRDYKCPHCGTWN